MTRKILIVQGHPDPAPERFGRALTAAYAAGAREAGHEVRLIEVADLSFPLLRSQAAFKGEAPPAAIRSAQEDLIWAEHLVLAWPLWLGGLPALTKGFLEQLLRPDFAFDYTAGGLPRKRLKGRSARIVVTMGMPALAYRWYFGAHSLKSLERNILGFCGIAPIRESLIGGVEAMSDARRAKWLERMGELGRRGR